MTVASTPLRDLIKEKIATVTQREILFVLIVDTTGSMRTLKDRMVASLENLWVCISELQCNVKVQMINMKDYSDFKVDGVHAARDPRSSRVIYEKMGLHESLSIIRGFECNGGGDFPEAINQALSDAAKIVDREATDQQDVYIVFAGDAPGHGWGVNSHVALYDAFPEDLPDVQDLFETLRCLKGRVKGCFCILFGNSITSCTGALPIFKALAETLDGFALWNDGYSQESGALFDAAVLGAMQRGMIRATCNTQALASLVDDLVGMQFPKDEVVRQLSEEAAFRTMSSTGDASKAAYPKSLSVVSDVDNSFDVPFERIQTLFADPSATLPKLRELMRSASPKNGDLQSPILSTEMPDDSKRYRSLSSTAGFTEPPIATRLNSSVVREDATLADAIASLIR